MWKGKKKKVKLFSNCLHSLSGRCHLTPPGKGRVSPHPSCLHRAMSCAWPGLPCPSEAAYSLHCVAKARRMDGKGAWLPSCSGGRLFCEPAFCPHAVSVNFHCCSQPFQVWACQVSLFQNCWPITCGIWYAQKRYGTHGAKHNNTCVGIPKGILLY